MMSQRVVRLAGRLFDITGPKTFLNVAVWTSAAAVGIVAVLYARLVTHFQNIYFAYFKSHPIVTAVVSPFFFLLATWIVRKFGPDAKGSGIPQVLSAIELAGRSKADDSLTWRGSLVSLRTAIVKVVSSCIGILGGASIGREGPTVQIAASGFAWVGNLSRRFSSHIQFQTFLIAGSAAGVAAAFNTPMAGITFAIEELGSGAFNVIRQVMMLAIVISGIIAQGLAGNYLYFGQPSILKVDLDLLLLESMIIGMIGGLLGGLFAKILANPRLTRLPEHWMARAFIAGAVCSAIAYLTDGLSAGSGYEFANHILNDGRLEDVDVLFPIYKLSTTVLSYLSGMAGGIFSPSLSIGAGIGLTVAKLLDFMNFKACALFGMVAFFSGAVRAPLTAVIIVIEMTNEHSLILPLMATAYLAYSTGRRVMPEPLYHFLSRKHLEG